ncbi:hypothetical protein [Sphingomonas prati]|uniref:Uncharacterized protein n=1 Tax=Sphingomonas prati TaxID=1843237 RepID=A0A7W9F239_9SPHN|nr:hypothetical protein [Sphingomonas prati]MBB5728404.1 hypothetical protein [Sphingomonas prati]
MKRFLLSCAMLAAIVTAPVAARDRQTLAERGQAELAKATKGLVRGEPVRCLPLSSVQSTQVITGVGLLYDVGGGRKYLNAPQSGASWLDWNVIPVSTLYGGSACRLDAVRLIDRNTRMQGGFVVLDDFVPYMRPDRAK